MIYTKMIAGGMMTFSKAMRLLKAIASVALMGVVIISFQNFTQPVKTTCSEEKKLQVLAPASERDKSVKLDCNLTLSPHDKVSKQIIFEGEQSSGVTLNCNGATLSSENPYDPLYEEIRIYVKSAYISGRDDQQVWSRPQDIAVNNCNITGAVRIKGMASNASGEMLDAKRRDKDKLEKANLFKESSFILGHSLRAKNSAPKNITFTNVKIQGRLTTPLYISPGVTYFSLIDSEIYGSAGGAGIYLDAESGYNTFKNNYIHRGDAYGVALDANTGSLYQINFREQVSIDGSAYNHFYNNRFSGLGHGGILFYRNCGEDKVIRHQAPQFNELINNAFYYKNISSDFSDQRCNYDSKTPGLAFGDCPSGIPPIWLGARNGTSSYCHDDYYNGKYQFGSSLNDGDFASNNVIAQNKLFKLDPAKAIWDHGSSNLILNNSTESGYTGVFASYPFGRRGCYLKNGFPKNFLLDKEYSDLQSSSTGISCSGVRSTCNDGVITASAINCSELVSGQVVDFDCTTSGNNGGCSKAVSCPTGTHILAAKAACNLEIGSVDVNYVKNTLSWNNLSVVKASDISNEGRCRIDEKSIQSGSAIIDEKNKTRVFVSCSEHDRNGGDCNIRGQLYCQNSTFIELDMQIFNPVYRFLFPGVEHFLTTDKEERITASGLYEGLAFYTYKSAPPSIRGGSHIIYRCRYSGGHFISSDSKCEGQTQEGQYGYIYNSYISGTRPLYRFFHGNDHLITVDYAEGAQNGYAFESILGYVPITSL